MPELLTKDVVEKIVSTVREEFEKMPKLNIMVLGKTGVGKSTLINSIFGDTLVRTGIGKPVTADVFKVEKKDFPLALYDTPGLELRGDNDFGIRVMSLKMSSTVSAVISLHVFCSVNIHKKNGT